MQKILIAFVCCFVLTLSFGQRERKVSAYLSLQYNTTLYDRTLGNNPSSVGVGLQGFLNSSTKFKPMIDLTADGALEDDDVLRLTADNKAVNDARGVINLFAGTCFLPTQNFYASFVLGPSFIHNNTYLGIKPSVGYYFSKKQRVTARLSYINIFNREFNYGETKKEDFGSISLAIAIKLF